jgi:hypothetical protein
MVPLQQTKLFEGKKHWDCTHLHCNKQTKKKGGKEGKRKGKEGRKERKKERKKYPMIYLREKATQVLEDNLCCSLC